MEKDKDQIELVKEKKVKKAPKRGTFRVFGIVIPSVSEPDKILGYAVLDVKNYKTRVFTINQTLELVARYPFENAKIENGKLINTECAMSRLMQFNTAGQVIGNKGITILGEITKEAGHGYRVINFEGKVADLKEEDLIQISTNVPLINAKVVAKGTAKTPHISAIKGEFPKLTAEDVERLKKNSPAQSIENKERYIEKIREKFKYSIIDKSSYTNWHIQDDGRANDKSFTKFKKAIKRYVEEYAKVAHPSIVKAADKIYGIKLEGVEEQVKHLAIVKACTFIETFDEDKFMPRRPTAAAYKTWTKAQLLDPNFIKFAEEIGSATLKSYLYALHVESKLYASIKEKELLLKTRNGRKIASERYNKYIAEVYESSKESKQDTHNMLNLLNVLSKIKNTKFKAYISTLPLVYQLNKLKNEKKVKVERPIVQLKLNTLEGIKEIGYCVKESDNGKENVSAIYGTKKPLRYVFDHLNLSIKERNEIINRSTCFGDMAFAAKLLGFKTYGTAGLANPLRYSGKEEWVDISIDAIMIILAIYNLDLAKYLNETYKLAKLDLDDIGHEDFYLSSEDKIYYQSGGKFNKSSFKKGSSWFEMSKMPGGLRSAIALSIPQDITETAEKALNYLYLDL